MSAYIIVDVSVLDKEEYKTYVSLTPDTIAAYGGKFIVRGGKAETLEGDWSPGRIVVLEFKDLETARSWWASELYAPAKSIRQRAAMTQMILVEGV